MNMRAQIISIKPLSLLSAGFLSMHKASYCVSAFKFVLILFFTISAKDAMAEKQPKTYSESSIKVAIVYNLLHFIDWPHEELQVCVVSPDKESVSAFNALPTQTKTGKGLSVKFLYPKGDNLAQSSCHVMFISKAADNQILTRSTNRNSLTIGESSQFIKNGGMINFVRKDLSIKFEINISALKQAEMQISSQVLRIADRVYTDDK